MKILKSRFAKFIIFSFGTKYASIEYGYKKARCCNCGKMFVWNEYDCEIYRGKVMCAECFANDFGYCNECGELNRYDDMDDDIICEDCHNHNNMLNDSGGYA